MANIKIGNLEIDNLKVGTLSVDALYIGDVKIYPSTPPGPTPTYEWKQYNAGETVPSKLFYGVRLGDPSMDETSIEFGDYNTGIAFGFDVNSEYGWYAQDMSGEQIDITEYYDETERCFIIYFSDLGFSGMPISYPIYGDSFEFDVQLYEEYVPPTPTYEWKQYYLRDTVPSKLFYGVKLGDPSMNTASIEFSDAFNTDIAFIYDVSSEYGWYAQDMSGEQIDISEYYDETERCFIIYFSDLGLGAMPLYYPAPNDSFEFDVQLYEEHT